MIEDLAEPLVEFVQSPGDSSGKAVTPLSTLTAGSALSVRAARGSIWSLVGHGVTLLLTLGLTPFLIRRLGAAGYGVLALINTLIGYASFSDLGVGLAVTRYAADAHSRFDDERESAVVWTAMLISVTPMLLAGVLLASTASLLVTHVFTIPDQLQGGAVIALRLTGIVFVARGLISIVRAPQLSRIRIDRNVQIASGVVVLQAMLTIAALLLGGRLVAVVAAMAIASLCGLLLHYRASLALLPSMAQPSPSRQLVRPLLGLGSAVFVCTILETLMFQGERLFLARFATVAGLAYYAVAGTLAQLLQVPSGAFAQGFFPAFSHLQHEAQRSRLQDLYVHAIRAVALVVVPFAGILYVVAEPFLKAWVGEAFATASLTPFYLLCAGWLCSALAQTPGIMLNALGRTMLLAKCFAWMTIPFVLGAALISYRFGIVGAAAWWTCGAVVRAAAMFFLAQRAGQFTYTGIAHGLRNWLIATVATFAPLALIGIWLKPSLYIAGLMAMVALTIYAFTVWRYVLDAPEKNWALRFVNRRPPANVV